MNKDIFTLTMGIGDRVVPSENWGSNSCSIVGAEIVKLLKDPNEYILLSDCRKSLNVYPYEVEEEIKNTNYSVHYSPSGNADK